MSDEDPIRWAEGGGPPGASELVRSIARPPVVPPDLRGSITRRLAPPRVAPRTRMIAPGVVATAVVIGGIALWAWQRPAPRVVEVDVEPEPVVAAAIDPVVADAPAVEAETTPEAASPPGRTDSVGAPDLHPSSPGSDSELQSAIIAGDSRTIVRLLGGGRAHGATQLRALWNAQRALGDRAGACVTVRQLVVVPGVPPAQRSMLQHYLDLQCQRVAVSAPPVPTPSESGSLSIATAPWSRVFLDGVDTGLNTPVLRMRVDPGHHVIGFQTSDGTMYTTEVDVPAGEVVRLHRQL